MLLHCTVRDTSGSIIRVYAQYRYLLPWIPNFMFGGSVSMANGPEPSLAPSILASVSVYPAIGFKCTAALI